MNPHETTISANDILKYWFDGSQAHNYKVKWFPSGNVDIQHQTDTEIYSRFHSVFEDACNDRLSKWRSDLHTNVALIIVLDQFSRHIYRYLNVASNAIERKDTDVKALTEAELLIANHPTWSQDLSVAEFVFVLMPFRHNQNISRLQNILHQIDSREMEEQQGLELLNKFRKQTLRRLQHLQDRSKAEASDDILERHYFVADETDLLANNLVHATTKFLKSHMIIYSQNRVSKLDKENIAISLSGGVDSMVIAKILSTIRASSTLLIDKIIAIHIDYANRPESGREAQYVEEYCNILNLTFEKRVINEVTRGITDRNEYEKVAREIRYDFYQQVLSQYQCKGVIFGHHIGDLQENVISNVMRGSSPIWLSGMSDASITNGVEVWRPLLAHSKAEIYNFAHRYGVPYFKDTTPSWSTRGKLRNQLVPLLTDLYGAGFLRNLSSLAMESDQMRNLLQETLFQPFLNSAERYHCGVCVSVLPYRNQSLFFWKEMLKELMHSMGMSLVREKAVQNFMDRLFRGQQTQQMRMKAKKREEAKSDQIRTLKDITKSQEKNIIDNDDNGYNYDASKSNDRGIVHGWIELRKGFHCYLSESGNLIIFKDGILYSHSIDHRTVKLNTTVNISDGTVMKADPDNDHTNEAQIHDIDHSYVEVGDDSNAQLCSHTFTKDLDTNLSISREVHNLRQPDLSPKSIPLLNLVMEDIPSSDATDLPMAFNVTLTCVTNFRTVIIYPWKIKISRLKSNSIDLNDIDRESMSNASNSQDQFGNPFPYDIMINLKKNRRQNKGLALNERILQDPKDLLTGHFSYNIQLSMRDIIHTCATHSGAKIELMTYAQRHLLPVQTQKSVQKSVKQTKSIRGSRLKQPDMVEVSVLDEVLDVKAISNIDNRLKTSIPILIPILKNVVTAIDSDVNQGFEMKQNDDSNPAKIDSTIDLVEYVDFKLEYEYIGVFSQSQDHFHRE